MRLSGPQPAMPAVDLLNYFWGLGGGKETQLAMPNWNRSLLLGTQLVPPGVKPWPQTGTEGTGSYPSY